MFQTMTLSITENKTSDEEIDAWASGWERHGAGGAP